MSTVDGHSAPGGSPSSEPADLKLETVVIPVTDADRPKAFYAGLCWGLDADPNISTIFNPAFKPSEWR